MLLSQEFQIKQGLGASLVHRRTKERKCQFRWWDSTEIRSLSYDNGRKKPRQKMLSGDVMRIYEKLENDGVQPSISVTVAALKACGSSLDVESGKRIHANVIRNGDDSDKYVATTLMVMYGKLGSMVDARKVFDRLQLYDVVSWNAIIMGYAESGEGDLALFLFTYMQESGCVPDSITYIAAVKACSSLASKKEGKDVERILEKGRAIHSQAAKGRQFSGFVANSLVDMYSKCGSMVEARRVFDKLEHRNVVSWSSIILGYAEEGKADVALHLYETMQAQGCSPNSFTFVAALKACASLGESKECEEKACCLEKGRSIHTQVAKTEHQSSIYVNNTLVDMYVKCGSMVDAQKVFDNMTQHTVISWNCIILGYAEYGRSDLALDFYSLMQSEGCIQDQVSYIAALKACGSLSDSQQARKMGKHIHSQVAMSRHRFDMVVLTSLVDMYANCGSMVDARRVFDSMQHRDVVSWNTMIQGYADNGESELALEGYKCMLGQGFAPQRGTFVATLKACGNLAALEVGRKVHADICRARLATDSVIANTLVDFYGKCGSMADAQLVFDSIDSKGLVTWSALIAGYSRQGDSQRVFNLFDNMKKEHIRPDGITFQSVLAACSHAGLVQRGGDYFQSMCLDYEISPRIEHYTCMVDLLARANHLNQAMAMVQKMPFEPTLGIWAALLSACRKWTNVKACGETVQRS